MPDSIKALLLTAVVGMSCQLFAPNSRGADAVFSNDGQRIYAISNSDNKPALREINLADQTVRTVPLRQLPARDSLYAITRSDGDKFFCVTEKSLWTFDPTTSRLTKICDASKGGRFWRVAYNPKSRTIFVTAGGEAGPLLMLKDGRELISVWVRRHDRITAPIFSADGELFYSETGDLWSGEIESEEGRFWLTADRYAPLAYLETTNGTPSEMGVSDIAVARDAIYVQLFRMGGSGWGAMLQLPRPPRPTENQTVSSMAEMALKELDRQKEILQGLKSLGENNRPACLCTSPDESRVYYTNEDKDYLITGGQTQELHLRKVDEMSPPAATTSNAPNQTQPAPPTNAAASGDVLTDDSVQVFAEKQIGAMCDRDLNTLVSFYAENVDYLGKGVVSNQTVRDDLQKYFDRWPSVRWELAGAVQSKALGGSNYQISFPVKFEVNNPTTKKRIAGTTTQTEMVTLDTAGNIKIITQQEKITRSDSPISSNKPAKRRSQRERVYDGRQRIVVPPGIPWPPGIPRP